MTGPDEGFSPPQTVVEWQASLLRSIRTLAAEHTRVSAAGWENFEAVDGDARSAWETHLDALEAQRQEIEQVALTAGLDATTIADASELGHRSARPTVPAEQRHNPVRDNVAQDFYIDMMTLDLWHLERMASLAAARADRIATGRWSFGINPLTDAQFAQNMGLRHQRITALAHAAEITATEAETLWGPSAEDARRAHAVYVETHDELNLATEWNFYAAASPDLAIPPYLPPAPAAATSAADGAPVPPTPQQMIDAASASLRARFVDAAVDPAAITAAVDAALPDGSDGPSWIGEPDQFIDAPEPPRSVEYGTDF
ncbi:hypothetical protein [Nocardia xishanensis]